jgi:DNA-binding transcriptional ArsR family regulator
MDKVNVSEDLLKVKDLIRKPSRQLKGEGQLKAQLQRLGHKVDNIEKIVAEKKGRFCPERTREIMFLLENKEMSAEDIGRILKMSRNRANEYLRKLEKDLLLRTRLEGRKKYYRAIKLKP